MTKCALLLMLACGLPPVLLCGCTGTPPRGAEQPGAQAPRTLRPASHAVPVAATAEQPELPACGNGRLDEPEACDDGNLVRGDGCNERCRVEAQLLSAGSPTCVLLVNGQVKCWGNNDMGQLGYGDRDARGDESGEMGDALPPVDLGTDRVALALETGGGHSCAILDDHSVKCWGWNNVGQLGYGDHNDRGDRPGEMGDELPRVDLGAGRTARAIALGSRHGCALLDDGTVKCWGGGGSRHHLGYPERIDRGDEPGEMGDRLPTVNLGTRQKVKALAAGDDITCAILENNQVKCWGVPDGTRLGYGKGVFDQVVDRLPFLRFPKGKTVETLTLGVYHACALFTDKTVGCWGDGSYGQLGDAVAPDDCPPNTPVDMLCRGTPPQRSLELGGAALAVVSTGYGTCVLVKGGGIKCWGADTCGALGTPVPLMQECTEGTMPLPCTRTVPTNPIVLAEGGPVRSLVAGAGICVLFEDRRIKCWGCYNDRGQLGYGDTLPRPQPTDEWIRY